MNEEKEKMHSGKISKLLTHIFEGKTHSNQFVNRLINLIRIFIAASRKFLTDDCFTKTSSISYTTIMSLIPMLTVVLTFYSIFSGVGGKKEEIFTRISQFMIEHNIKLNIDPLFEVLSKLIENAAQIGGIGIAVLIFSATAVLRTIDKSLNDIWQIKKPRPILLQVIYYWAALTLGPIMLIAGTTLASQFSAVFSAPAYRAAVSTENGRLWLAGSKGTLAYSDNGPQGLTIIHSDQIDFDNQENFLFDAENQIFRRSEFRLEKGDLSKAEFYQIAFQGSKGYACGKDGLFVSTSDGGKSWNLKKLGFLNLIGLSLTESRLFILSAQGIALMSKDNGRTFEIVSLGALSGNLNALAFHGKNGAIAGSRGTLYLSQDGGLTWQSQVIQEARLKKELSDFNTVFWADEKSLWLGGEDGKILMSPDGGKSWYDRSFLKSSYSALFFYDSQIGYAAGEKGTLIYTQNGGERWQKVPFADYQVNHLGIHQGDLYVTGEAGLFMTSEDQGKTFNGVKGKSLVVYTFNFLAPFFFIWLLFLLAYKIFPNTRVSFKGAALGAAFTSAVWVGFILFFTVYIKWFAQGTYAIYGALAAFPIFLLLVYSSGLIMLYGAEVSFVIMHPRIYQELKRSSHPQFSLVFLALSVLEKIYRSFEEGKGALPQKNLEQIAGRGEEEFRAVISLLSDNQLILKSDSGYLPARNADRVLLSEVMEKIHDSALNVPDFHQCSESMDRFARRFFEELRQNRENGLGKRTLKDLLNEIEK